MSDPFPTGLLGPPGRDPSFQRLLLGGSSRTRSGMRNTGIPGSGISQCNTSLPRDIAIEAAYAGLRGVHLPLSGFQYDRLTAAQLALGSQLQQVTNPFFGLIANGPLSQPTVQRGQLLMPFPQYTSTPEPAAYIGNSIYHSLQMKAEKRFGSSGTVLASYTFSKIFPTWKRSRPSWMDQRE